MFRGMLRIKNEFGEKGFNEKLFAGRKENTNDPSSFALWVRPQVHVLLVAIKLVRAFLGIVDKWF